MSKLQFRKHALIQMVSICLSFRRLCFGAAGALLFGSIINLAFPMVVRTVLDTRSSWSAFSYPTRASFLLVGILLVQGIAFYFRALLFGILGHRVVARLRELSFQKLLTRSISFFDLNTTSELVSRLGSDLQLVQDAVSQRLSVILRYGVQVIFGTIAMVYLSPRLSIALLLFLPFLVFLSMAIGKKLKQLTKSQLVAVGRAQSITQDFLSGVRVLRAFNAEERAAEMHRPAVENVLRIGVRRSAVSGLIQSIIPTLMNGALVLLGVYGLWLVHESQLRFEDLVAFALYGAIVAISFAFVASGIGDLIQSLAAYERIEELSDGELPSPHSQEVNTPQPIAAIKFQDVSFAFPARSSVEVLRNVSFTLRQATRTAIGGSSGAGKSSVLSLLLGFYAPTSGSVAYLNSEGSELSSDDYLSTIGYVPQEPTLFNASILQNLMIGNSRATTDDIQKACESVNMLSFIESLPEGFGTSLGEQGGKLSLGQRQRLAIARALLRNPSLLILDEATSALDAENELNIIRLLQKFLAGRILVLVSHRLTTIERADQILVLDGGQLIEHGTHETLKNAREGVYSRLLHHQTGVSESVSQ